MEDKNFNPADRLNLIESMLKQAKSAEKDNGLGWVIWGWLLFLASTTHYLAIKLRWEYRNYIWTFFGIIAVVLIIYTFIIRRVINKKREVITYTGQLVTKLGLAFFISLFILSYGNFRSGADDSGINFGYLLILYAFWMFIFAAAFRFMLFYWGAAANWAGALIIFYFKETLGPEVLLLHAACVAIGYLIPGHLAYSNFYKSK